MFHWRHRVTNIFIFSLIFVGQAAFCVNGTVTKKDKTRIKNAVVENVTFYAMQNAHSSKKIARNGVLVKYNDAKANILICHGFMANKFDAAFLRRLFPRGQFNIMTFDFRAHGENTDGQYCTFGRDEAYDVRAAVEFIKSDPDLKDKPLFAYGFSMGAVAAIQAQAKDKSLFKGMILDCPFDSTENVIKRSLENVKFSLFGYEFNVPGRTILQKYAFHPYIQSLVKAVLKSVSLLDSKNIDTYIYPLNTAQAVKNISVPCFFISCKKDEKVSVGAIKSIFNSAAGPKKLWLTNGRGHFDSFFYNPELYTDRVRDFVDRLVDESFETAEKEVVEDEEEVT